ncbi:hypothetical protein AB0H63_20655 [Micromonospora echinospora]|uniref:hypothetical protein n=1 Tax=Micromonospora echinospora TaxID=1877 RepID=UPI0033F14702
MNRKFSPLRVHGCDPGDAKATTVRLVAFDDATHERYTAALHDETGGGSPC